MALRATATIDASTIIPGRELIFNFTAISGNNDTLTITIKQAGKYNLDNNTLTNVATVVYEKNAGVVTGIQTFVATDTLKVTITRTTELVACEILMTGV